MVRKHRKSIFGATAIVVAIAVYLFVIVIVVSFFYFFKFQITLVMSDIYVWNKVQEVPLSLLSMDVEGEPLVNKANKVYYGFVEESELEDEFVNPVKNTINDQIFYFFEEGVRRPFGYVVYIFDTLVDESPIDFEVIDCKCDRNLEGGWPVYKCQGDECAANKKGDDCGIYGELPGQVLGKDHSKCFNTIAKYQAEYPLPLTFNGTNKLVDEIKYKVTEYHA